MHALRSCENTCRPDPAAHLTEYRCILIGILCTQRARTATSWLGSALGLNDENARSYTHTELHNNSYCTVEMINDVHLCYIYDTQHVERHFRTYNSIQNFTVTSPSLHAFSYHSFCADPPSEAFAPIRLWSAIASQVSLQIAPYPHSAFPTNACSTHLGPHTR